MGHLGKYLRRAALSLMFLLTVAANCFCESYDDDPYDDTPPITFEFHFVKPQAVVHSEVRRQLGVSAGVSGLPSTLLHDELFKLVEIAVIPDRAQPETPLFSPLRT